MMGSRGDPPTQATALAVIYEIVELLRNADKTMPAAVKELRVAAAEAKSARDELDKMSAKHAYRAADLETRAQEIERARAEVAQRELACQARDQEAAAKEAGLVEQRAALAARKQELDRQQGILDGDKAEFAAAKLLHAVDLAAKTKALAEETERQHRESETAVQGIRDDAAADIREWRANAQAEMEAQRQELDHRSAALAAKEEQFNRERARFSALLRE